MKRAFAAALVLQLLALPAYGFVYWGEAIEAYVVDADTGSPIEGVHVAAKWELRKGTLDGTTYAGMLHVAEAKTDKDGRFVFASWGPSIALTSHLHDGDPALYFFKPGYLPHLTGNPISSRPSYQAASRSVWNGKKIRLEQHGDNWRHYFQRHSAISASMAFVWMDRETCSWRAVTGFLSALERERERLTKSLDRERIISANSSILNVDGIPESARCGSPAEIIRRERK